MSAEEDREPISAVPAATAMPAGAVFLSYASEDAAAAERIATALSSAGVEVWFDKSELRGGDAWDRRIREQIHRCRLFVPVVSANTEARVEGYFRREWKLAVDRTHDLSDRVAFLIPVVTDSTLESKADVPEAFRHVQWTRLPHGETPPAFVERVKRLLSPESPATSSASSASGIVASPASAPRGLVRRPAGVLYWVIAAALLLALGYFGVVRVNRSMPSAPVTASIAVLPLANESGDAGQQYFSDGISEDLITALSQFPGLKVIGRTSAFQFRDSKEDSRSIGSKLGVAHLLEGSVRKSGDMIRVSAELIDTNDGSTQWTERYDRPYKDLFALQDEITRSVAGALRMKLLPGEHAAAQSERPPSGSLEAYNALLQGQFYSARGDEGNQRKAIEFYTQATQIDPGYALAWSLLSRTWTTVGGIYLELGSAQDAYAKARAAADRALTLAPGLAAAHLARGFVLQNGDFNWYGAEAELRRALELAPDDPSAQVALGALLATLGKVDQAIALTRQALATDPLRARSYLYLADYLSGLNRLDEAEQAVRRAFELNPAAHYHYWFAVIATQRGDAQAALAAAQRMPPGWQQDFAFALARQIGGDRSAAEAALKTLTDRDANIAAYQAAEVYALRNEAQGTFAWLDRAWSNREAGIIYLLYDPFILRYKDDPRFAAFCRKVGLPTPAEVARQK